MLKFNLLFSLLCTFFFISCKSNTQKAEYIPPKPLPSLENNRVVELKLDSTTSCHIVKPAYFVLGGEHYLVLRNKTKAKLLYFDFLKGGLIREVKFNERNNDRIGELFDFFHFSQDTLILKGDNSQFLYVADRTGAVYARLGFGEKDRNLTIAGGLNHKLSSNDNNIYYNCCDSPINLNAINSPGAFRQSPFWAYNIAKKESYELKFSYPEEYFVNGFWNLAYTRIGSCSDDKGFVFSFPASHYLHTFRKGKLEKHLAASSENPVIEPLAKSIHYEDNAKSVAECYNYFIITYDSYRKRYYRFLFKPVPEGRNIDNLTMANVYAYKPCTILIFDKNFKKLGEYDLPNNRFFVIDHFVAPDGLYISENHPENPELNEDILRFRKISFDFDEK